MRIENNLTLFWDGEFSNFHPCTITINKLAFNCSEQLFMYFKAMHFNDIEVAALILEAKDPMTAKRLGRKVKNYDDSEWSKVRYSYMFTACYEKFAQNIDLKQKLLETSGTEMVEASPFDKIWGIGIGEDDPDAWNKNTWNGLNLLGLVLDEVRSQFQ
jgi:ribA/ribD-fused uncharacterized protein